MVYINPLKVASCVLWGKRHRDPADVLPIEVVEKIFEHSIENIGSSNCNDASRAPLQLCLVSKRWRNIAYGNPSIWRFISVNVASGKFKSLNALQARILRTRDLPLIVELNLSPKTKLHEAAPLALLEKSNRISKLSFCPHKGLMNMLGSRQFSQLTALTCVVPDIICNYPTVTQCTAMAPLFHIHGHQLLSLSIPQLMADISRMCSILTACPNLQFLNISFVCDNHNPAYHGNEVVLSELTHLSLNNLCRAPHFLETFRTPVLTSLTITWLQCQSGEFWSYAVDSCVEMFLESVPSLERLETCGFFDDESRLLGILSGLPRITHLHFLPRYNRQVITGKTFEMLTIRRDDGTNVVLPRLEELVIQWPPKTHIQYSVIENMIKSRSQPKPCSERLQSHGMLKYLDVELLPECWWTALRLMVVHRNDGQLTVRCHPIKLLHEYWPVMLRRNFFRLLLLLSLLVLLAILYWLMFSGRLGGAENTGQQS